MPGCLRELHYIADKTVHADRAPMYTLTLQLHAQGKWQDAMALNFAEPEKGFLGSCQYGYTSAGRL